MKILSIRIKNLASLAGEHFIDFESQPLASAGLVAIVGKTGAGKSTILDAMCLALFNRIPRLKDSDGKLLDVDGSELLTNSPLTVLRRGTGHGFAELSFVAQDQKIYVARWEIKRARENPNAKLQSVQRSLKCLTDGNVVADKAKAVESQILRITQLSFEQFTRAVLLAQSEVTAFLKARDNERGELLEYLTNSSIFGKIGQLAYEKTKQIAIQRKELENVLGHIELLTEEDLATITNQFNHYSKAYLKLETDKQKLSHQKQWFDQKQKIETDIQTREQHLNLQQQKVDALAPQKEQLKQLETFASIRPNVIQQKELNHELSRLQPNLELTQQQFNEVEIRFKTEKIAFEKIDAEQQLQQKFEIEHQEKIERVRSRIADRRVLGEQLLKVKEELKTRQTQHTPLLNNEQLAKNDVEQLKQSIHQNILVLENSEYLNPLDDSLSAHINQLQRFIQSYTEFENQYGSVKQATQQLTTNEQQLALLTQQHGQDNELNQKISSLRNQRDELLQKLNLLTITKSQWNNFQSIYAEKNKYETEREHIKNQITQVKHQLETAEKEHQNQKTTREHLQKIMQQQRLLNTENIEKLRANLINGEACLVCGSTQHPFANKDTFSDQLFNLQLQQEQQAIETEKVTFDIWQQLQKTHAQYSASFATNDKQLLTLKTQLQQSQSQIEQQLSTLEINFNFSLDHSVITQAIEASIAESLEAKKQIEENLSVLDQALKQRFELSKFIQQTNQHLSLVKQTEENIQDIVNLLSPSQQQNWTTHSHIIAQDVLNVLKNRQRSLKQHEELNQLINKKSQHLEQCSQAIKFSLENIQSLEVRIENLLSEGKQNSDIAIQIIYEMTQKNVEKPHEWLANFEQNRQRLNTQFNQARQRFNEARQVFETAQSALNQYQTQHTQLQSQMGNLRTNIHQWLSQHTAFDEILIQELSLISHQQELHMKQEVQSIEHLLTEASSALKTVQEQRQQHIAHQPEIDLESLIDQFNQIEAELKLTAETRDELKLKLEVHQQNLAKQQQFADQIQKIQKEEHRWNKISSLMGDSTGKKFRDYAQQYNLDILIEYANQQLSLLSQRYTLKRLDNSLSLAIVDHDMDGETRSVSSLSGGESFLTALALSLAIANMASGSMKIESLFIDEGFGTLDASSLHMVMNALDQLQSQGRKVVLISHIQEMHERIPVQIQVSAIGAGASTIRIVG